MPNIDEKVQNAGYNTRVIAFYHDPEESVDDINHF
jgi:hypothetical protein